MYELDIKIECCKSDQSHFQERFVTFLLVFVQTSEFNVQVNFFLKTKIKWNFRFFRNFPTK